MDLLKEKKFNEQAYNAFSVDMKISMNKHNALSVTPDCQICWQASRPLLW